MKEIILWAVATIVVGLILYVVESLIPEQAAFRLITRVMAGVLAIVFFILFLVAVAHYTHVL